MGSIKDIVDLARDLANSVEDRKFADPLFKIIDLILAQEVVQDELREAKFQLAADKLKLEQDKTALQTRIDELEELLSRGPPQVRPEITDIAIQVLLHCSLPGDGAAAIDVSRHVDISEQKALLEISNLYDSGLLVYGLLMANQPMRYRTSAEGLTILDERGLI